MAADKGKAVDQGAAAPSLYVAAGGEEGDESVPAEGQEKVPRVERGRKKRKLNDVPEEELLWKLKCSQGQERAAVRELYNKKEECLLKCAIFNPSCEGYIFVEAELDRVKQACRGIQPVKRPLKAVPVTRTEMRKMLASREEFGVQPGDWVVMTSSIYKGDLAKVLKTDPFKEQVEVKLVPRIDPEEFLEGNNRRKKQAGAGTVKPRRLITFKDLNKMGIPVKNKKNRDGRVLYCVGSTQFFDGYLLKNVSVRSVQVVPSPSPADIQAFQSLETLSSYSMPQAQLVEGDEVVIVEGKYADKVARVVKVLRDGVSINLDGKEITLNERKIRKLYHIGSHVSVASGEHEGVAGIVTCLEGEDVILRADTSGENIRVPRSCLAESVPVLRQLGAYQLHDLVMLELETCGMVLSIDKEALHILKGVPDKTEFVRATPAEIFSKIADRNANCLDCAGNVIRLRAVVRVQDGAFKGKEGQVEHINAGVLFVHSRQHLESSGFFCVRARSCFLLGGELKPGAAGYTNPPQHKVGSRPRNPMLGKEVRIMRGSYKSYRGRVVRVFASTVHVFLEANLSLLAVPEAHVKLLEPPDAGGGGGWGRANLGAEGPTGSADGNEADWGDGSKGGEGGWGSGNQENETAWMDNVGDGAGNVTSPEKEGWGQSAGKQGSLMGNAGTGDGNGTPENGGWGDAKGNAGAGNAGEGKGSPDDGGWGDAMGNAGAGDAGDGKGSPDNGGWGDATGNAGAGNAGDGKGSPDNGGWGQQDQEMGGTGNAGGEKDSPEKEGWGRSGDGMDNAARGNVGDRNGSLEQDNEGWGSIAEAASGIEKLKFREVLEDAL